MSPSIADYDAIEESASRKWAMDHPQDGLVFENSTTKTVLTTSVRSAAVDFSDPTVSEGLRLSIDLLDRLVQDLTAHGINAIIIIIPTKELVFAEVVEEASVKDPALQRLVENELLATENILRFCSEEDLACLHLLSPLRKALDEGVRIYPASADGHPDPDGHTVIAQALLQMMIDLGWYSNS